MATTTKATAAASSISASSSPPPEAPDEGQDAASARSELVEAHPSAIVEPGAIVGEGTKIWHHAHVRAGATIGARCMIGMGCYVAATVRIGNGCRIQNQVSLFDGVELDDDVFVGPSAVFTNVKRPRAKAARNARGGPRPFQKTRIGRGATIGANATVLCGITVGEHAMIGAGAVVTANVPPYALMMGVPARRTAWVCACGETLDGDRPTTFECAACAQ